MALDMKIQKSSALHSSFINRSHGQLQVFALFSVLLASSCCLTQADDGISSINFHDAFPIAQNLPDLEDLQGYMEDQINFNPENIRGINHISQSPVIGLKNPASAFCESNGGRVDIRRNSVGDEVGYCIFPDGSSCEEWSFFNGECSPSQEQILKPDDITSAVTEDLIIQGRVTQRHMVGPNSNNNFIIIEVLNVRPKSRITYEYSPGSTVRVCSDEYAMLYDCKIGDCYEFRGVWENSALWLYAKKGHYALPISCSDISDKSDESENIPPVCVSGYTGKCKCVGGAVRKEIINKDCELEWIQTENCRDRGANWGCKDCQCVENYVSPSVNGKILEYCVSKGPSYQAPQMITADVKIQNTATGTPRFKASLTISKYDGTSPSFPNYVESKPQLIATWKWIGFNKGDQLYLPIPENVERGSYGVTIGLWAEDSNAAGGWVEVDSRTLNNRFNIEDNQNTQSEVIEQNPADACSKSKYESDPDQSTLRSQSWVSRDWQIYR